MFIASCIERSVLVEVSEAVKGPGCSVWFGLVSVSMPSWGSDMSVCMMAANSVHYA